MRTTRLLLAGAAPAVLLAAAPAPPVRPGSAASAILPAPAPSAGAPQSFKLDNGLQCILVENHEQPLIRMELVCRWDRTELPVGKEGIGGFLPTVMAAGGAGSNSRQEFLRALDRLGVVYDFQAQVGRYGWSLAADSRSQETAMELLADAVVRPAFDGPMAEGVRLAASRRAVSGASRERAAARFLWSIRDPGILTPPGPTPFERIELQDLIDFRQRVIRPEASTLAFYGDLNLAQAKQLALMHLGIWGPAPQPPLKGGIPPKPSAGTGNEPRLLALLDSGPSAELWAGAPRPAETGGPAVEALLPILLARAAPTFFGDMSTTFQLQAETRGPLVIKAKVPQAERDSLVAGFKGALEGLRASGFSSDDLACAFLQWKAENAARPLHPEALLRDLVGGRLDPELARAVDQVTLKQVNNALKAWLQPDRLRFLLLGADAPTLKAAEQAGLGPSLMLEGEF